MNVPYRLILVRGIKDLINVHFLIYFLLLLWQSESHPNCHRGLKNKKQINHQNHKMHLLLLLKKIN